MQIPKTYLSYYNYPLKENNKKNYLFNYFWASHAPDHERYSQAKNLS